MIKKYSNRKFYDTERKHYINLTHIINMIKEGRRVLVLDNITGQDITKITLLSAIMTMEKQYGNFPIQTMIEYIRAKQ